MLMDFRTQGVEENVRVALWLRPFQKGTEFGRWNTVSVLENASRISSSVDSGLTVDRHSEARASFSRPSPLFTKKQIVLRRRRESNMNPRYTFICVVFLVAIASMLGAGKSAAATPNPVPYIDAPIVPAAAAPGAAGFTLTVNGSGFVASSVVQWNGTPRATTFVSATQLTATILATDLVNAGTAVVTVVSPAPGGGTSNAMFFQVGQKTSSVAYFSTGVPTGPNANLEKLFVADFNGDGKQDVATLNADMSVAILLGNGDGTFASPVVYPTIGTSNPPTTGGGIAVGDFNGDGKLDIAVSNGVFNGTGSYTAVFVLPGNGDGTFGAAISGYTNTSIDNNGSTFLAADFNGDGKLDLVTDCESSTGGLCVLVGNGDGTFSTGAMVTVTGFATPFFSTTISDFNGDANLDLAISYPTSGGASIVSALGNGDGTFQTLQTVDTISLPGVNSSSLVTADFDGNGLSDLAIYFQSCSPPNPCVGNLSTYSGNGDGTFQTALPSSGAPAGNGGLVVGDFNADGILDVAVINAVLLGRGDGTFALSPAHLSQVVAAAGDFNGDGKLDLLAPLSPGFYEFQEIPGDFTGYSNPNLRTVVAGAAADYFVYVEPLNGFLGDTTLTVTGLPAGVTATFTPATIVGSNGVSDLYISTSSSTVPGIYTLSLTGTSGGITHSAPITLIVNPAVPDFTGGATPTSQTIGRGMTGSYAISVESLNGFSGNVTLSVSGLPSGTTASFSPNPVVGGSGVTTLTVTTSSSTPIGTVALTLTGTSGSLTHSSLINLNVTQQADFTGGVSPLTTSVIGAGHTSYTINIVPMFGFTGNVTLGVSGLPTGATAKITPGTIIGGTGSASLVVTTTTATPIGSYTLTISGTCGTLIHSTTVQLNVNPSAGDFTGGVSPPSQAIAAGAPASYTVYVAPLGGFTGDVTLTVSGLPAGVTASFNPGNVITGASGSTVLTISNTGGLTSGTYPFLLTGTSGGITHSLSIGLTIN
jgi:hypothetical protein